MNMSDLKNKRNVFKKFFVAPNGEIFTTEGLHEELAREICKNNQWEDWKKDFSAEEYLIKKKCFIKYSNYDARFFRFVAVSKNAEKEVINNAYFLSDLFNLRIEWY